MIPLRDENPTKITPYLTWALIAVNVVIYLLEFFGGLIETRRGLVGPLAGWTLIPFELTQGGDLAINGPTLRPFWLTIFTSMFLHGSIGHLLGNMLYLLIFGNNIEDALGRIRFLLFYLACGVAAAGAQILMGPSSPVPMLGASGAIAGVLGAYLVLYPKARVLSLVIWIVIMPIRVPAWVLLGVWIVSQFFNQFTRALMTGGTDGGGVAYVAHIGGFLAGMLLIKLLGGQADYRRPLK